MNGSARCLHIDLEGLLKGHRFSYRAHIEMSGDESLDNTVDDFTIEFREDESWPLANQAWQQMTAGEDRALSQMFRNDVMSAYLMKRIRGDPIDWVLSPCSWGGRLSDSRSQRRA